MRKMIALVCCFIGIAGMLFLGAYGQPIHLDLQTVAVIAH